MKVSLGLFASSTFSNGIRSRINPVSIQNISRNSFRLSKASFHNGSRSWKYSRTPNTTGMLFGATGAVFGLSVLNRSYSPIFNDSALNHQVPIANQTEANLKSLKEETQSHISKLNYEELTVGSITGLLLGVIAGKLSSIIVALTLSGYFLTQFLESRGIVNIPWRKAVRIGSESIDLKKLVLEQPCFKVSFVLSFLIAAYNI